MTTLEPTIVVNVDVTNPGQFFACCGLLALTDRRWPGAEGWFLEYTFNVTSESDLPALVDAIARAELIQLDPSDPCSSPIRVGAPFRPLTVDWWQTDRTGAKDLKVWAGSMESYGIARAMQHAMRNDDFRGPDLFQTGMVVPNPEKPGKKKEPYYFDARRATNAHSRDIGFSPNDLSLVTVAYPAVELLCLIGLQVARPAFTTERRVYDYCTWFTPLPAGLLLPAASGAVPLPGSRRYRFHNWFRTGQKKHKSFRPAVTVEQGNRT